MEQGGGNGALSGARKGISHGILQTRNMHDIAGKLSDLGQVSLLSSCPGRRPPEHGRG